MIQQPSPREATGKIFLKWRGKSPLRVGMRCPGKNCNRVENTVSLIGVNPSCDWTAPARAALLESQQKRDIIRRTARGGSARPDSACGIAIHCVSQEMKRDEKRHLAVRFLEPVAAGIRPAHFRARIGKACHHF